MDFVMPADAPALSPADRRAAIKWPTRHFYWLRWLRLEMQSFRKQNNMLCWVLSWTATLVFMFSGYLLGRGLDDGTNTLLGFLRCLVAVNCTVTLPFAAFGWFTSLLEHDAGKFVDARKTLSLAKVFAWLWLTIMIGCALLIPFA